MVPATTTERASPADAYAGELTRLHERYERCRAELQLLHEELIRQQALTAEAEDRAEHLTRALAGRDVIGQAKGIVMERCHVDAEQAWQVLVAISQRGNVKVRALAESIARTGSAPGLPPRRPPRG